MEFFTYPALLIKIIFFIGLILFGSLIKYHFDGGRKYQLLIKISLFLANIPMTLNKMIRSKSFNSLKPPILTKHKNKKRFEQFVPCKRDGLLVLPRYDHSLNKAVVDVIDINNFEIIHTYQQNILKKNKNENPIKLEYYHPLILDDGSLISEGTYSPLFKINFNSNLKWINDEVVFHHSKAIDHEENIWILVD